MCTQIRESQRSLNAGDKVLDEEQVDLQNRGVDIEENEKNRVLTETFRNVSVTQKLQQQLLCIHHKK